MCIVLLLSANYIIMYINVNVYLKKLNYNVIYNRRQSVVSRMFETYTISNCKEKKKN